MKKSNFNTYAESFNTLLSGYIDRATIGLQGASVFELLRGLVEGELTSDPTLDVKNPSDGQIFIMSLTVLSLLVSFCRAEGQGVGRWLSIMSDPFSKTLTTLIEFQDAHPEHMVSQIDIIGMAKTWTEYQEAYQENQEEPGETN
jgi:hypothetical protein